MESVGETNKSANNNLKLYQKRPSSEMDILDIDEELKDDSFICLEDKTHDDVSNILQQWRNNNRMPMQSQKNHEAELQQYEQEYKLNSRTFTRPRRKSTQNLELLFSNTSYSNGAPLHNQQQNSRPMVNLEIGGLVTPMHKSFLQDTSPPSSICSSMDASTERMNNSLITSADFTNINFLQSTQSIDFNDANSMFNLEDKSTSDGYTLNDLIRDRKALESLTMSGEGTLKDSHIAQIDDISLTFSKTASGCSTMDNSTDSGEGVNRTVEIFHKNRTYNELKLDSEDHQNKKVLGETIGLTDEMIGETTFNLVENSIYVELNGNDQQRKGQALNVTHDVDNGKEQQTTNNTFNKPTPLDETICFSGKGSSTYDFQQVTPDAHCATPENKESVLKFYESTPLATKHKPPYAPSIKIGDDENLSPIVTPNVTPMPYRNFNATYEQDQSRKSKINSDTFSGVLKNFESMEMIENIANPKETFSQSYQRLDHSAAGIELQNVMNLAQVEANLLAGNNDEEEFEHMLDEFSKVEQNVQHIKMKKSLETIKKRFNYGEKNEVEISREARDMRELIDTTCEKDIKTINSLSIANPGESMKELRNSSTNELTSSTASSSGERLLGLRSRLYDGINLSTFSTQSTLSNGLKANQDSEEFGNIKNNETDTNEPSTEEETTKRATISTADSIATECTHVSGVAPSRHAEKRERNRDRFKTIKIVKEHNTNGVFENADSRELNVPCIDDDEVVIPIHNPDYESNNIQLPQDRYSRSDQPIPVFNNNKSEIDESLTSDSSNKSTNYLTYKKPKERQLINRNFPETRTNETAPSVGLAGMKSRLAPRSLSRPRCLSGFYKFSTVSKATSASELEKTSISTLVPPKDLNLGLNTNGQNFLTKKKSTILDLNLVQPSFDAKKVTGKLKSPMGIKSKSFHNLSSNLVGAPMRDPSGQRPSEFGQGKPTKVAATAEKQKSGDAIFRVPKLVSGIRVPNASGIKRAGLVRPSSGYYSLNVADKGPGQVVDLPFTDRHSPTTSMSSASSRNSIQNIDTVLKPLCNGSIADVNLAATLTKITTSSNGIPKPSGLRPPTNIKRSGLPRPSSIVRR